MGQRVELLKASERREFVVGEVEFRDGLILRRKLIDLSHSSEVQLNFIFSHKLALLLAES